MIGIPGLIGFIAGISIVSLAYHVFNNETLAGIGIIVAMFATMWI